MSLTYVDMYENEVRAIEISIRDQDDVEFEPSSAYATIVDSNGDTVVAETAAMVAGNQVYTVVNVITTETPGDYEIIWKILKVAGAQTYVYYHKTHLVVNEL